MADIMRQSILDFPKQFAWHPKIENRHRLKLLQHTRSIRGIRAHSRHLHEARIVIAGMGGSALPGALLHALLPSLNITSHRNYGLPPRILKNPVKLRHGASTLLIAVSYSGNTEETIDAFQTARKQKIPVAVVTAGGKLLRLAKSSRIPYIQLPDSRVQPRMALGFMLKALSKLLHERTLERRLETIKLNTRKMESAGKRLARALKNRVPIIYASEHNAILASLWKIKFNETAKIPAFWNVLPELNHNEMTGFDSNQKTRTLSQNFSFLFLADKRDDTRIQKRMRILGRILKSKKMPVSTIPFDSASFESLFTTILFGDWTAYSIAKQSNADPNAVPLVEKFKQLI